MTTYSELNLMNEDMKDQHELYQPSEFWREASKSIVNEILDSDISQFRALPKPLGFFVPTYGCPGNSFNTNQVTNLIKNFEMSPNSSQKSILGLKNFLSGYNAALSDYRVFLAADDPEVKPELHNFSESNYGNPIEHWTFNDKKYSRSALNYLLGLSFFKKYSKNMLPPQTVLEIGGGFGTLGEILCTSGDKKLKYIDVDIPPMSFVAEKYLTHALGSKNVSTYKTHHKDSEIVIESLSQATVLASWQIEKLVGHVDLFVNFISFQEMEPEIVQNYLDHVSRLQCTWILLRNMREGKQQKNEKNLVGVKKPITSNDYLDMLPEYELISRNIVPFGYQTVDGFHSELFLLKRKNL